MSKDILNTGSFSGKTIIALTLLLLVTVSCLKKEEETKFRNLIPEKDFVSILGELHMTNGLLSLPQFRTRYMSQDTTGLYVEIIEGYGYTTGQMDTTIQYYYIRKPKKLIKIYDQLLGKFTEIQTRLEQKYLNASYDVADQWNGNAVYFLPDPAGSEKPDFKITLETPGIYTLRFSVTVFPDDQTFRPFFTSWICDADSLETGKKDYLPSITYIKDGLPHNYTVTSTHTGQKKVILEGRLYDFTSNSVNDEPHARIEDITFYYSGNVQ